MLLGAVACAALPAIAEPRARISQLVTDFSRDLPPADSSYPDASFTLRFKAIRPLPGSTEAGDVFVQFRRRDGKWDARAQTAAADYNQRSQNTVEIDRVTWERHELAGKIRVVINPDAPRPRVVGFPSPADRFEIEFSVQHTPGKILPWQPESQAFMPPWRRDEPTFGGEILAGTYTAVRGTERTAGSILGAVQPVATETTFGTEGSVAISASPGGGMAVLARMSPTRVAAPNRAMAVRQFAQRQDWSQWQTLRIRASSTTKRDDAAIAVAIRDGDGQWRQITSAALLLGDESDFDIPLRDFGIDSSRISGLAIGVDNPHGVGDVQFVVKRIELLHPADPQPSAGEPVRIDIDPATAIAFNGVGIVPKGLFGFHDVNESKPRSPTTNEASAIDYLRALRPGLLRPLQHVGFGNGNPISDDEVRQRLTNRPKIRDSVWTSRVKAADAMDDVIWTHTADLWARPPWMDEPLQKTASGVRAFYRRLAADAYVPGDDDNESRLFEVWNEPFMWARHINMGKLNPVGKKAWTDPTQYGYIPAKLGADVWSTLFLAAVDGAKTVNPNVQLGGPSCPELGMDDYGMFESYIAPILDVCHDKLDFLTEHHYGGNPRSFAAGFEVLNNWTDVRFNRRIPVYVTEANDLGASSAGKASYNIEDILTCIRVCPDKARGRAIHAMWDGYLRDEGEFHAYTLLSQLRGQMIQSASSDEDVTVVASTPSGGQIVIVAHNRAYATKKLALSGIDGFTPKECLLLLATTNGPELNLKDTEGAPAAAPANGKTRLVPLSLDQSASMILPARSAVRWTFEKPGYRPTATQDTEQFFFDVPLSSVKSDLAVPSKLLWHGKMPPVIHSAKLRLITRDVDRDEAVVVINGHEIALPRSTSNDGNAIVQEVVIDPAWLKGETQAEFRCTKPAKQNGFRIYSASICVSQ